MLPFAAESRPTVNSMPRALIIGAALAACASLSGAGPAHAYLDPASGSLLLQVVLGGVAGLLLALKLFWRRILERLGLRRGAGRVEAE